MLLAETFFVVVQSFSPVQLCDPMDCSLPGFPVLHGLPELVQTHVHWLGDAIQPSYPLLPPFSSCPQSFPVSESFPISRLFASGGQSIGASASVLPMNILGWFPLGLTGLIPLLFKGLSRVISSTLVRKHHFFWCSACFMVQLSYLYMPTGNTIALTIQTFVSKVMFLLFNILSMFVIAFLPRNKLL